MSPIYITTEHQYKLQLVEKIVAVIQRMHWKAYFYKEKDNKNNSSSFFGLNSDQMSHSIKEFESFEKDLFKLVPKVLL